VTERTAYVTHSDCSRHDTGWRHPDHQGRLPAVARAVHRDMLTLFDHLLEVEGTPASVEDLRLAHTEAYIARVEARCQAALSSGQVLRLEGEVVVSGASWEAALAAVGCVLTAVDRVAAGEARNAFCAVRPPGHGAWTDRSGSFGLFNSVAVAARRLMREMAPRRVLVVEWGSRPGRGTESLLSGEAHARFVSVHLREEGGGPAASDNPLLRGLPPETTLPGMLSALRSALDHAEVDFAPDFVLLSLGCDALEGDPLGGLSLAPRDYYDLTTELRTRAERLCGGRLVSILEEGYDAEASARAVVQHLRALARLPPQEP
jgi:acetoin utilization deacetylase AcuC-like enzyme